MKKVLVLAGGYDQIFLIEELKKRDMYVILADYLDDPPAKNYADVFMQKSTLDEDAILKIAIDEKVDLVTTACTDQALKTVAYVSEKLGLPCYISSETARNVTDKTYMKTIFAKNGIPSADFCIISDASDYCIKESLLNSFPLVVKPCDCNSSKGITKVMNECDLKKAIEKAVSLSRTGKAIVETFVEGKEVTIDVWNDCEGSKVLSVSEIIKARQNETVFTIVQNRYPAGISESVKLQIDEIAASISKAFGLCNCPLLIQAFVDKEDRVYVGEFSARMGGGAKHVFIKYMSGLEIMHKYVDRILGSTEPVIDYKPSDRFYEIDFMYAYDGMFNKVIGIDDLMAQGDVLEFFEFKNSGSSITKRVTSSDRIAGFLIGADSEQELNILRKRVWDSIDAVDTDGKSILVREFYE